ncbi:MAG: hypothetical protein S4CHLAM6_07740 [Chlamydiae bacterium]|nr:hypothetical protein [Chlamydiota bacterium]
MRNHNITRQQFPTKQTILKAQEFEPMKKNSPKKVAGNNTVRHIASQSPNSDKSGLIFTAIAIITAAVVTAFKVENPRENALQYKEFVTAYGSSLLENASNYTSSRFEKLPPLSSIGPKAMNWIKTLISLKNTSEFK